MKITGPSGPMPPSARRSSGSAGSFQPAGTAAAGPAAQTARSGSTSGVSSIDALLAMQEVGGPLERRRRSVRRAGRILDGLDRIKLDMLDGDGASQGALTELMTAVRDGRGATDDPGLEGVLDEIETRAAVELAKAERARADG